MSRGAIDVLGNGVLLKGLSVGMVVLGALAFYGFGR